MPAHFPPLKSSQNLCFPPNRANLTLLSFPGAGGRSRAWSSLAFSSRTFGSTGYIGCCTRVFGTSISIRCTMNIRVRRLRPRFACFRSIFPPARAAPNSLSGEYAHPAETLILGVGTIIGPLCLAHHITSVYIWIGIRLLQVVECHSGYDFPWSPRKFIPFWGGAEFHDFHHETFVRFDSLSLYHARIWR